LTASSQIIASLPPREPPARIDPIRPFHPSGGSRITASSFSSQKQFPETHER
jgi:hypothetical protein